MTIKRFRANKKVENTTSNNIQSNLSKSTDHSQTDQDDVTLQLAKPTIRERNASMFNNEMLSDVHFQVGPPGNCCIPTTADKKESHH